MITTMNRRGLLLAAVGACLLLGATAQELTTAAATAADAPTAVEANSPDGIAALMAEGAEAAKADPEAIDPMTVGLDYPIPAPYKPACLFLSEGVLPTMRKMPLFKALKMRLRAPFGPGSFPNELDGDAMIKAADSGKPLYGWTNATVMQALVRIDMEAAKKWLPDPLLTLSSDIATIAFFWYSDSFCCGAYSETAILFNVEHNGKKAVHCPWMRLDSDTGMNMGRDILGFPKKIASFEYTVTPPGGKPIDVSSDEYAKIVDAVVAKKESGGLEAGTVISASATRNGVKIMSMSGKVAKKEPLGAWGNGTGFFAEKSALFLNVQTAHPLPVQDGDPTNCEIGNRPKLIQFVSDEVPVEIWELVDPVVTIEQTKSDAIGLPFGISTKGGTGLKTGYPGGKLDVINATFGVTNFQTGEEKQASMGTETVPAGFVENDLIYWLRYM